MNVCELGTVTARATCHAKKKGESAMRRRNFSPSMNTAASSSVSARLYYRAAKSQRVLPSGAAIKSGLNIVTLLADPEAIRLDFIHPSLGSAKFDLLRARVLHTVK